MSRRNLKRVQPAPRTAAGATKLLYRVRKRVLDLWDTTPGSESGRESLSAALMLIYLCISRVNSPLEV